MEMLLFAEIAQSVEQGTENPCVGGSIPPLGTTSIMKKTLLILLFFSLLFISSCDKESSQLTMPIQSTGLPYFESYDRFQKEKPELARHLNLFHFGSPIYTHKSHVRLKGKNDFLTPTFVNKTKIELRDDGRFNQLVPLKTGWNLQFISFQDLTGSFVTIKRVVYRFPVKLQQVSFRDLSKNTIRFINSPLYLHRATSTVQFSRHDMAYLLTQLGYLTANQSINVTLNSDDAIRYVLDHNLMALYYDGKFHGNQSLSYQDATVYLAKTLWRTEFMKDKTESEADIYDHARSLLTRHNVLTKPSKWEANKALTVNDLVALIDRISLVEQELKHLTVAPPNEDTQELLDVMAYLRQASEDHVEKKIVTEKTSLPATKNPVEKESVSTSEVATKAPEPTVPMSKQPIATTVRSMTLKTTEAMAYSDIDNHWVKQPIRSLAAKGFKFDATQNGLFRPNDPISRADFARLVYQNLLKHKSIPGIQDIVIENLDKRHNAYKPLQAMVALGIISKNKNNRYAYSRTLKRSEGITMLVRLSQVLSPEATQSKTKLKFRDLSNQQWLLPYLSYAVSHNMIKDAGYFKPSGTFDRAQFATVCDRLPYWQDRQAVP